MSIYMYMCIHTCAHTREVLFPPWEGRSSMASWVWRRENPSSVPRAPLQRCRNCGWGASQWPSVGRKWQCGHLQPAPSVVPQVCPAKGGCLPLDSTVWAPWALAAAVASLLAEDGRVSLVEKHRSCCLLSARHGSASGGRGPSLLQKAQLRPCLALFHEVNEKIVLTHLSLISVPGMRAPKKGIEPWVFWQSYRRCQNCGAETEGAFCALGHGSEQQQAQRLWKAQP